MIEAISTSGFETKFLERLKTVVAALPAGRTAELSVSNERAGTRSSLPHFRIKPSNQRSARIEGFFIEGEGINFTMGEGTWRELYVTSETGVRQEKQIDRFFEICQTIFSSKSTEVLTYSSSARLIRSRLTAKVNGRDVLLGGGQQFFWWLFPGRVTKRFSYEPY